MLFNCYHVLRTARSSLLSSYHASSKISGHRHGDISPNSNMRQGPLLIAKERLDVRMTVMISSKCTQCNLRQMNQHDNNTYTVSRGIKYGTSRHPRLGLQRRQLKFNCSTQVSTTIDDTLPTAMGTYYPRSTSTRTTTSTSSPREGIRFALLSRSFQPTPLAFFVATSPLR